jgi:hypothetical protein
VVLRQTQRHIVMRAADEPRGRLVVPTRQQQQANIVTPQFGQHAGRQHRVAAQYDAFEGNQRNARRELAAEPHGERAGVDVKRRSLAVEI